MQELIGKEVNVYTSETVYRGILIEIGESEIYLQSESGWIVIPVEKVADISRIILKTAVISADFTDEDNDIN
ncbi:MAG: hypothetical protein C4560_04715 [Nitrospiraceae bacterium]|nr:MAG: hypothetical protein C4560_04715 [Nitrospiraceae bacterium]